MEENIRLTEDRTSWCERSCAAGAAKVRTDDADKSKASKTEIKERHIIFGTEKPTINTCTLVHILLFWP